MKQLFQYLLIRALTFPLSFSPFWLLHFLGKRLGILCYYLMKGYRKRALSNLATVEGYWNKDPTILKQIAKESFQNLLITLFEYPKFSRKKDLTKHILCENPEEAKKLIDQGQGIVFFCGHQANWEVLFLEGTNRMLGIAIGRPIKNRILYAWITKIREKQGGKMVTPRNALREGLRALRAGKFLGIVGDQGMPESPYAYSFFGKRAFTSPAPAILAYKAKCPIIVATTRREKGKYRIHYSEPIWPDLSTPLEEQIDVMMKRSLSLLEESIRKTPGQWLWQHNRWKQQTAHKIYYRFRKDPILIILPKDPKEMKRLLPELKTFRDIFPKMSLSVLVPKEFQYQICLKETEILPYDSPKETLLSDYRFKLIFNLANFPKVKKHYEKLSAFETFTSEDLKTLAKEHLKEGVSYSFSEILRLAILRPEAHHS